MSFFSTDPPSHRGQSNTWLTPLSLVRALGEFDLDPCAYPNHGTAKKLICLPHDGLTEKWDGRVWLNPPYGKFTKDWLEKLKNHKNGTALVFARLDTKWILPFLEKGFFALTGRVKFISPTIDSTSPGTGSILIPFSEYDKSMILQSELKGRFFL